MEQLARILIPVYGVLMLIGGIGGYAKAHSKPSLIAGIVSGILMGVAFYLTRQQPRTGFGLGALVALGLVVVFIRRIQELSAQAPPGSIGMNVALCALSGIVAALLAIAAVQTPK